MSEPKDLPRPSQTTLAGWVIVVGAVFVALSAFESLGSLRSRDTAEMIADVLDEMGNPAGVSVADGVRALRAFTIVAAVCAAASAVLGWFALRRDRGARIGLTVLAVPLAFSTVLTGGFVSFMVVASVVLLWVQPSRNWFAGLPPVTPPVSLRDQPPVLDRHKSAEQGTPPAPPFQPQPPRGATGGRPVQGFGTPPSSQQSGQSGQPGQPGQPQQGAPTAAPNPYFPGPQDARPANPEQPYAQQPAQQPYAQQPYGQPGPIAPPARPVQVLIAAVVTFVSAGIALLSSLATLAVSASADEKFFQDLIDDQEVLADQGVSADQLGQMLAISSSVVAVLSLLALLTAALTLAGNRAARTSLLMLSAGVFTFSVLGILASPLLIVTVVAAGVVLHQLTRPQVNAWFRSRDPRHPSR